MVPENRHNNNRGERRVPGPATVPEMFQHVFAASRVTVTAIKYGSFVIIAIVVSIASIFWVHHLRGQDTRVTLSVNLGDCLYLVGPVVILAVIFGIFGVIYGRKQSVLRTEDNMHWAPYREVHQKSYDPERTSSGLTRKGEAPEEET